MPTNRFARSRGIPADLLVRNWLLLVGLTLATAALAPWGGRPAAAALLLLAALGKSRAILGGFLHLDNAPGWRRVFLRLIGLWLVLLWAAHAILWFAAGDP